MKRGYNELLYNQRNKDDATIMFVIKRLFGEYISSRLVKTQNKELLSFRCIGYNMHRLTSDVARNVSERAKCPVMIVH